MKERNILKTIHNQHHFNNISRVVKIPQIMEAINVQNTSIDVIQSPTHFLMDYVDGKSLANHQSMPQSTACSVFREMTHIITHLGSLGIGHFGLEPKHITIDVNGRHYWLMGWSYSFNLKSSDLINWKKSIGAHSKWEYYSPQLIQLNKARDSVYRRIRNLPSNLPQWNTNKWLTLITDANLYSLQATI